MKLDRDQLQGDIHKLYREEHEALGEAGTVRLLDKGRKWDSSETLRAGGKPELLPGIDELGKECEGAAVVTTVDPFHHSIGYRDSTEESLFPEQGRIELARQRITGGIEILEREVTGAATNTA